MDVDRIVRRGKQRIAFVALLGVVIALTAGFSGTRDPWWLIPIVNIIGGFLVILLAIRVGGDLHEAVGLLRAETRREYERRQKEFAELEAARSFMNRFWVSQEQVSDILTAAALEVKRRRDEKRDFLAHGLELSDGATTEEEDEARAVFDMSCQSISSSIQVAEARFGRLRELAGLHGYILKLSWRHYVGLA